MSVAALPDDSTIERDAKQGPRERILECAKELVAQKGPIAVTVRDITEATGVNVAAVNYHFGSKQALLEEVLVAIITPVNRARAKRLTEAEARHSGNPVPIAEIVDALVRPTIEGAQGMGGGSLYLRVLQHLRATPTDANSLFVFSTFDPYAQQFIDALHRTLPQFTRTEIAWRYELTRGGAIHILVNSHPISPKMHHLTRESGPLDEARWEMVLAEIVAFTVAGFGAAPQFKPSDLLPGVSA